MIDRCDLAGTLFLGGNDVADAEKPRKTQENIEHSNNNNNNMNMLVNSILIISIEHAYVPKE